MVCGAGVVRCERVITTRSDTLTLTVINTLLRLSDTLRLVETEWKT